MGIINTYRNVFCTIWFLKGIKMTHKLLKYVKKNISIGIFIE